jgi:hypothetical protein
MVALSVVAAIAAIGVWRGTTPLVVVAGIASFLAGLEAVEPLAQEIDHPVLHELLPVARGRLFAHHLVVPAATMVIVGACGLLAVVIAGASGTETAVAAMTLVPAALASTAGAAVSTVRSQIDAGRNAADDADASLAMQPEITGMRLLYETGLPPAIAALGFAPVVAAQRAAAGGFDPVDRATSAVLPVLVAVGAAVAWIRYRDELGDWHRRTVEEASAQRGRSATPGTR